MSRVIRRFSEVTVLFVEEQPLRGEAPLYQETATALATSLGTHRIVHVEGERSGWQTGPWLWNGRVRVAGAGGGAFELSASVEGTTAQANDVLLELWDKLGEITNDRERALQEVIAHRVTQTYTTIHGPDFESKLAPFLSVARSASERVRGTLTGAFRIEFPIRVDLGGTTAERSLLIERRMVSSAEQHLYWVRSPLASDDHDRLLAELFGALEA